MSIRSFEYGGTPPDWDRFSLGWQGRCIIDSNKTDEVYTYYPYWPTLDGAHVRNQWRESLQSRLDTGWWKEVWEDPDLEMDIGL
jgi:hypothetical protein